MTPPRYSVGARVVLREPLHRSEIDRVYTITAVDPETNRYDMTSADMRESGVPEVLIMEVT